MNKDNLLTLSVVYFQNPLSNCDSNEKVLKSLKEVGLAKSEKKHRPPKFKSIEKDAPMPYYLLINFHMSFSSI